jgi:hypothetical protein
MKKMKRFLSIAVSACVVAGLVATQVSSRTLYEPKDRIEPKGTAEPLPFAMAAHRAGKIVLAVTNNGAFGTNYARSANVDLFTQQIVPSCQYPKFAQVEYLYGAAFWIGAVIGRDTLVSVGHDGWIQQAEIEPLPGEEGRLKRRSIVDPTTDEYIDAISEEDFICTFSDTVSTGKGLDYFGRAFAPLNFEVLQRSFAWSYSYAEDFVLFDFQVKNSGFRKLQKVYMGVYVDADVAGTGNTNGFADDLCGFVEAFDTEFRGCNYRDTVNLAWIADNDGDLTATEFSSVPAVTATRIVRTPNKTLDVSFNWWIGNGAADQDFGPREKPFVGRLREEFRDYRHGGLGTPEGNVNKYYVLRNREFDYDQAYTATIDASDTLWMLPNPSLAPNFADGFDTRYLLSFGPFDIAPGEVLPISLAYVGGENFHTVLGNLGNLPNRPDVYYANLGFKDLATNGRWASWVYDNPGVDTDGDGNRGDSITCEDTIITYNGTTYDTNITTRTVFIRGDGVPDFRGASPPPAPKFRVDIEPEKLTVIWNGFRSENDTDAFAGVVDFEGYRVYISRTQSAAGFSVVSSYDIEDFNKYVYDPLANDFVLADVPFSRDQLKALYGAGFDPDDYDRNHPFELPLFPDSVFIFAPQDYNTAAIADPYGIQKAYPDARDPSTIPESLLTPDDYIVDDLLSTNIDPANDSVLKFYVYKFVKDSLQRAYPYYVNVTAFDYGSPASGLASLETPKTTGAILAYALDNATTVDTASLSVYVYPNPWRADGNYLESGYEAVNETARNEERAHRVNFVNLPAKCLIKIFSLDGDLIREIKHNMSPSDPAATHEKWDLITRNTQAVVSGLYYWTVEPQDENGRLNGKVQIGKLAIIR